MKSQPERELPIVTEIIRNGLVSVTNEMKIDLMRSSYNPIIHEMLDFSVGLFSERAETLAQAAGLPQFLCDMPNAITSILADIGGLDALQEGDVYLTNDPYTSSFHVNDVTVIEPLFLDGRVIAFAGAEGALARHGRQVRERQHRRDERLPRGPVSTLGPGLPRRRARSEHRAHRRGQLSASSRRRGRPPRARSPPATRVSADSQ